MVVIVVEVDEVVGVTVVAVTVVRVVVVSLHPAFTVRSLPSAQKPPPPIKSQRSKI